MGQESEKGGGMLHLAWFPTLAKGQRSGKNLLSLVALKVALRDRDNALAVILSARHHPSARRHPERSEGSRKFHQVRRFFASLRMTGTFRMTGTY